ncbi:DUF4382 domain-containing protein [Variovorax dokdonensis]|uniref:DUF4382 domain-containing protein n=1 Tax=Variovorax dokdonensis TaxID=344883 RepID=A0ABT7NFV8_9BURK|nr:DUF4382 domain-containing protein [Variovorax dokdonensis]MDM0046829.1 DUF4382 domain-containing protein [Variovorax dokdonensis]
MKLHKLLAAGAACALLFLSACGGGGAGGPGGGGGIGGTGASASKGTMRVSMTDAPACGYDSVNVTVKEVRVHLSADAVDDRGTGWVDIPLARPQRVDLLTLTNGVLFLLGEAALPAGQYQQMRLVLAENTVADPLANSVKPTGGAETPLDTPSGQQSGLKLNMNVDVPADKLVDVVLDFDACKSVVKRGNSGRYNLKPVITVLPVVNAGGQRVQGWVDLAMVGTNATVSLQFEGLPVKAAVVDDQGRFALFPVPAGTYDLVVTAPGRVTAVLAGVPVTNAGVTTIGSESMRIDPPSTLVRQVVGVVNPVTASVRAIQYLSGGSIIEVGSASVDGQTGNFSMGLPIGAPVRAPFTTNTAPPNFVADPAVAGLYTVQAVSGSSTQNAAINANAVVPALTFNVP